MYIIIITALIVLIVLSTLMGRRISSSQNQKLEERVKNGEVGDGELCGLYTNLKRITNMSKIEQILTYNFRYKSIKKKQDHLYKLCEEEMLKRDLLK